MKYIIENGIYHQKDAEISILYNDLPISNLKNLILEDGINDIYQNRGEFKFCYPGNVDGGADGSYFGLNVYTLKEDWYKYYRLALDSIYAGYMGQFSEYYAPGYDVTHFVPSILLISPDKTLQYMVGDSSLIKSTWTEANQQCIIKYPMFSSIVQRGTKSSYRIGVTEEKVVTITYLLNEDGEIEETKDVGEPASGDEIQVDLQQAKMIYLNSNRYSQAIIAFNNRENGYAPTEISYSIPIVYPYI